VTMQIKLQNLKRSYGDLHAVDDISLTIPSNTVFGIIGKSGAGKSTLVRLISTLEKCDEGEIYFDDKRIDNLKKDALIAQRRRIGMIFQNFNLFASRTAGENIAYPMEIQKMDKQYIAKRVKELLALVDLEGRGDAPISTLSGGQKQRIAIARALSIEPDILFCDEATSALDPQTTRSILNLIRDIQKKMSLTVVMITHQMEVAKKLFNRIAVMDSGNIVEINSTYSLFSNPTSPISRALVSTVLDIEIPDELKISDDTDLVKILYAGGGAYNPIISNLSKTFDVDLSILSGKIEYINKKPLGILLVSIIGKASERVKAIEYFVVLNKYFFNHSHILLKISAIF